MKSGGITAVALALTWSGTARAQGVTYFPGSHEHATVGFEDQWPVAGDFDFNDATLRVHAETLTDGGGNTVRVTYDVTVWQLGASLCAGAALHLPGVAPGALTVSGRTGTAGVPYGETWTASALDHTPVSDGGSGSVVPLWSDLRAQACGAAPGFLNTEYGDPTVTACAPLSLDLSFTPALAPGATPDHEPGDLFLYRCGDTGHQVHLSRYWGAAGGAFQVDPALFLGTTDDASDVDGTGHPLGGPNDRFYVHTSGVPFALAMGDGVFHMPAERRAIDLALPQITAFVTDPAVTFWHSPDPANAYAFPPGEAPPLPLFNWGDDAAECVSENPGIGKWAGVWTGGLYCSCAVAGPAANGYDAGWPLIYDGSDCVVENPGRSVERADCVALGSTWDERYGSCGVGTWPIDIDATNVDFPPATCEGAVYDFHFAADDLHLYVGVDGLNLDTDDLHVVVRTADGSATGSHFLYDFAGGGWAFAVGFYGANDICYYPFDNPGTCQQKGTVWQHYKGYTGQSPEPTTSIAIPRNFLGAAAWPATGTFEVGAWVTNNAGTYLVDACGVGNPTGAGPFPKAWSDYATVAIPTLLPP